jgi:hypothetical protein
MSKACQYATNDDKIFVGSRIVNVKEAQSGLQKLLHGPKSLRKGGKNGSKLVLKVGCNIIN